MNGSSIMGRILSIKLCFKYSTKRGQLQTWSCSIWPLKTGIKTFTNVKNKRFSSKHVFYFRRVNYYFNRINSFYNFYLDFNSITNVMKLFLFFMVLFLNKTYHLSFSRFLLPSCFCTKLLNLFSLSQGDFEISLTSLMITLAP